MQPYDLNGLMQLIIHTVGLANVNCVSIHNIRYPRLTHVCTAPGAHCVYCTLYMRQRKPVSSGVCVCADVFIWFLFCFTLLLVSCIEIVHNSCVFDAVDDWVYGCASRSLYTHLYIMKLNILRYGSTMRRGRFKRKMRSRALTNIAYNTCSQCTNSIGK